MKRLVSLSAMALVLLSAIALAAPTDPDNKGATVIGVVSCVDMSQKMLVIKDSNQKEMTIYWNESTTGVSELQEGQQVQVTTKEADGKTVATSIQVQSKKPY